MNHEDSAVDQSELKQRGKAALAAGNFTAAAAAYAIIVRDRPDESDSRLKLAQAYEEAGRFDDAVACLNHPSVAQLEPAQRRLASVHMKAKNYAAALPIIEVLLAAWPEDIKLNGWKARCDKKLSSASDLADRIQQGEALVASEQLEAAEQWYLALIEQYPDVGRLYLHLGQIYTRFGRWEDACKVLRAGAIVQPGNSKIRRVLARSLFKQGDAAAAIATLHSIEGVRSDQDSLHLLQRCHLQLRDWVGTFEAGTRLLSILAPDDPVRQEVEEIQNRALVEVDFAKVTPFVSHADPTRAAAAYCDIAERNPTSALAWYRVGMTFADAGRDGEAIEALRIALGIDPVDQDVRRALTAVILRTCDDEAILRYVEEAAAAETADPASYRWLARYHASNDNWNGSLESARKAIALDPQYPAVRLIAARALTQLSRLSEALDELDAVISSGATPVKALQQKADILVQLGRTREAVTLYGEALRDIPGDPLISSKLARAMLAHGDIPGFHRYFEKRREASEFTAGEKDRPFLPWNGELPIEGRLLVWTEATLDLGENILHLAFVGPLAGLELDIVLQVDPKLVELCHRSFPAVTVIATDEALPSGISHHTPVGSLSRWFKPDAASFGEVRPYLVPDVEAVAAHRALLHPAAGQGVSVGLAARDFSIDWWSDALAMPEANLVQLPAADESVDDLAAKIAALDLVICTDEKIAHLAGAIGTPTFLALGNVPSPYWLDRGERAIWYPAVTLVRRSWLDEGWRPVFIQVAQKVRDFAESYQVDRWLEATLIPGLQRPLQNQSAMSACEVADAVEAFVAQGASVSGAGRSALKLIGRVPAKARPRKLRMRHGNLLTRSGHWSDARAAYVALRSEDLFDPELEKQILDNSLALYDLDYALPIARMLARDEAAYRVVAANVLYLLRRKEEALAELRLAPSEIDQIERFGSLAATLLLELGRSEQAEVFLKRQAAVDRNVENLTLLGRSISAQRRGDEAVRVLDRAVQLASNDPAANFWRTHERVASGKVTLTPLPLIEGDCPDVARDDVVVFFAADSGYFWQHSLVLLASLHRHSPQSKCHVHVINPDAGVPLAIQSLRSMLPELVVTYTFETIDFEGCDEAHISTYYASVRFVRLREVFARSPATYLCVDADCIVRGSVTSALNKLDLADVGIHMRYDERPHMTVAAGVLVLRPTLPAAEFIARVAALIQQTLEAREAMWFLDQIILSHVVRELAARVNVSQLDMSYIDWFFRDDSLIWTGKGRRKSENNWYMREAAQYQNIHDDIRISELMPPLTARAGAQV
jgi:tetratricopeptide (TPR) repeat protein